MPALNILYPNGQVEAVQVYIWDTGSNQPVVWDGSVTIPPITVGTVDQGVANDGSSPWYVRFAVPQAVTGPLTDAQLRATAVPVSISGAVSGPVTVVQPTASNLNATVVGNGTFAAQVTGSVTANAGTNLNTSLLALETGGNLATIKTDADAISAVLGTTTGAAVITDANGTVQQYLRGLIKLFITAGSALVTASLAAGSNLIGKVGIDQTTPGTTNAVNNTVLAGQGWIYSLKNALSNTNSQVKSGAGTLGGYYIYNPNTSVAYIQIFDTATGSITVGTTVPKLSIGIPASSAANLNSDQGIAFATAICVAATTTATGASAPSTALDCNFWYK